MLLGVTYASGTFQNGVEKGHINRGRSLAELDLTSALRVLFAW